MKALISAAVCAAALISSPAFANADLAKKSNCLACHSLKAGEKLLGPAYPDIAAKYKGQKDAEAKLIDKVTKGGAGAWGNMPMPPRGGNAALSDADVKTLVDWILAGAK